MKLNEIVNLELDTNNEDQEDVVDVNDKGEVDAMTPDEDGVDSAEKKSGTYAGVRFSQPTVDAIRQYQEHNKIPNPVPANKLHTTLLYSRKHLPNYKPAGNYTKPLIGKPEGFEKWPARDGSNCLVLRYQNDELVNRHKSLMDEHDAEYDFPSYIPHVTFSYDIGDLDINQLPPYKGPIETVSEYGEDLDTEWATNNAK